MKKICSSILLVSTVSFLGACDNGSSKPAEGLENSKPMSSLTFSDSTLKTDVSNGVLKKTLGNAQDETQSFDDLQVLVFGPMCAGCHFGGGIEQPSLFNFTTADSTYAALVGKQSTQVSGATLVTPGNIAQSYLVDTLEGRQRAGSKMPLRSAPVPNELLQSIKDWIADGAKR